MPADIKRCPFCGAPAVVYGWDEPEGKYSASCLNDECGVFTAFYNTCEEAMRVWNRRTIFSEEDSYYCTEPFHGNGNVKVECPYQSTCECCEDGCYEEVPFEEEGKDPYGHGCPFDEVL